MFHLPKRLSRNSKTGRMPVSTSPKETCPDTCPLKRDGGCFGDNYPLSLHWRKVTKGDRGVDWTTFLQNVADIAEGTLWRHNQVGDLPGIGNRIDGPAMFDLIRANRGRKGFTYTHKPVTFGGRGNSDTQAIFDNRILIWTANKYGFTVNLSANNTSDADKLYELQIAPVVCLLPEGEERKRFATEGGNTVLRCPAEYVQDLTCKSCGLCARSSRKSIIGFTVHGAGKDAANEVAKGERS